TFTSVDWPGSRPTNRGVTSTPKRVSSDDGCTKKLRASGQPSPSLILNVVVLDDVPGSKNWNATWLWLSVGPLSPVVSPKWEYEEALPGGSTWNWATPSAYASTVRRTAFVSRSSPPQSSETVAGLAIVPWTSTPATARLPRL